MMINGHGDDIYQYPDIRINFSSNVYNGFSHEGLLAWLARRMERSITNYPEPAPLSLERTIARHLGLHPSQIMATNGATEAIYLIAQAFSGCRSSILIPTFAEYADACRMHGHDIMSITTLDALPSNAQMAWICNPNNPTGTFISRSRLQRCMDEHPDTVFVIDESYSPFVLHTTHSSLHTTHSPLLLALHSMTKEFAVPGLRLGYITGDAALLDKVRSCRVPWSMSQMSQDACRYLFEHKADYRLPLDVLLRERQRVSEALTATGCVSVLPSDTHILLCRLLHGNAAELKESLARHYGILIRDASNFEGLDSSYFRIAVQSSSENDQLIKAIRDLSVMV